MADGPLPAVDAPAAPGGQLHGPLKRVTLGRSRGGLPPIPFPVGGRDGGRRLTRPVRRRAPQEAQQRPQTRVVVNTPPAPAEATPAPSGERTGPSKASQAREAFYRAINQPDAEYFRGQPAEVGDKAHGAARGLVHQLQQDALRGQLQAMDDRLRQNQGKPKRTVRPRSSYRRKRAMPLATAQDEPPRPANPKREADFREIREQLDSLPFEGWKGEADQEKEQHE